MKNWLLKLALVASLSLTLKGAAAQGYTYEWLSPADAIQKVRDFEGNQTLPVTITLLPNSNEAPLVAQYTLTAGRYEYILFQAYRNGLSRSDKMWMTAKPDFYGPQGNPEASGQQFLSPDTAQAIAWSFIQTHYPHPEIFNEKWVVPEVPASDTRRPSRYFTCTFIVNLGNLVGSPSLCVVEVDSVLGQVITYYSEYFPVLISPIPTLTVDQAMAAAMNGMNVSNGVPMNNHADLDIHPPDMIGVERLEYDVRFTGIGPADPTGMAAYDVMVDANTGEVVSWDTLMNVVTKPTLPSPSFVALRQRMAKERSSLPPALEFAQDGHKLKLAFPPRLVNGCPYMYAGYLCYGSDARLSTKKGGEVNITGRGRQLSFNVGSRSFRMNGKVRELPAPPVIVDRQCYVPLEAFDAILPNAIHYSPFTRQVSFDPYPTRHKISNAEGAAAIGAGAVSLYGLSRIKRRGTAEKGHR